jgi:hypothetical protein
MPEQRVLPVISIDITAQFARWLEDGRSYPNSQYYDLRQTIREKLEGATEAVKPWARAAALSKIEHTRYSLSFRARRVILDVE